MNIQKFAAFSDAVGIAVGTMNSLMYLFVFLSIQLLYSFFMFKKDPTKKFTSREKNDILGLVSDELLGSLLKKKSNSRTAPETGGGLLFDKLADEIAELLTQEITRNPYYHSATVAAYGGSGGVSAEDVCRKDMSVGESELPVLPPAELRRVTKP